MKQKNLIISLITVTGASLFFLSTAFATNYYVRDGGGAYGNTSTSCNGLFNTVYNIGNGPNCAVNAPGWIMGVTGDRGTNAAVWKGGDTLYINGDSDITPGAQAQYLIGYGMPGSAGWVCDPNSQYTCVLNNIPAGSNGNSTSIIGIGNHRPMLLNTQRPMQVISANNNYITLQWLEITDHDSCAYNDPVNGCPSGIAYPDGIVLSGDQLILTDIYVHGFGRYGINAGQMGSAVFTRVWSIGNGTGGITIGNGGTTSITGTLTFNQPIIEWSGCEEGPYPLVGGIDNPSNYKNCFGQVSGGYGDGLAFGATGSQNAGNWTLIGPGSISFNTQDGFDVLHGNGNGTIQIDKMRFEGNAGNQVKINALNAYLTNSLIIADCGWWYGAPQSLSGGMRPGDTCRALGDAILFNVTNNSSAQIYNNTILSNGNVTLESEDINSTGCNASTSINLKNNIIFGGPVWLDDTSISSTGGNTQTTYIYNDGNNGNGAGTCGNLIWNEDYNIVYGTKNNNSKCIGAHDKCGVNPGFANVIPMGTTGGAANTFYQGQSAASLVSLSATSPAIAAGASGLAYWNNGNDYHNVTRTSPPSIGGLEASSCAVNGYGCFFNTDCCTGTCTNKICGTGTFMYGDVNGDGVVTVADASLVAQYVIGINVPNFNTSAAMVDGAGVLSIYDAYLISEYAVGLITKFPAQG